MIPYFLKICMSTQKISVYREDGFFVRRKQVKRSVFVASQTNRFFLFVNIDVLGVYHALPRETEQKLVLKGEDLSWCSWRKK